MRRYERSQSSGTTTAAPDEDIKTASLEALVRSELQQHLAETLIPKPPVIIFSVLSATNFFCSLSGWRPEPFEGVHPWFFRRRHGLSPLPVLLDL